MFWNLAASLEKSLSGEDMIRSALQSWQRDLVKSAENDTVWATL